MKVNFRNVAFVLTGIIVGSLVNMGIIYLSIIIIPPPNHIDMMNIDQLKSSIHLFQPKHFIMPFLAHASGSFVGALISCWLYKTSQFKGAMIVGVWFLIGGIANVIMLSHPTWFIGIDLLLAYIPMSYLAFVLCKKFKPI